VKNRVAYFTLSLCAVVLAYFALNQTSPKTMDTDIPQVSETNQEMRVVELAAPQKPKLSKHQIIDDQDHMLGSKEYEDDWCLMNELTADAKSEAIRIQRDYDRSIGREMFKLATYKTYDEDTMKAFRSQGDMLALGLFLEGKEGDPTERAAALKEYLVQGGTYALSRWTIGLRYDAQMLYLEARTNRNPEDTAKAVNRYMAALSVAQFQAMRGDPMLILAMGMDPQKNNGIGMGFTINDGHYSWIDANANALFEKYNKERVSRGLPEFEKHPPKVIANRNAELFARALENSETEHLPYWAERFTEGLPCVKKIMDKNI
jgi:hypothetical protein